MYHKNLISYSLKNITRKLNAINIQINLQHQIPFPKPREHLLSFYSYQQRWVEISNNGYFNRARLASSFIDFSFVRSLVADSYSKEGAHCFDPVSMFLCDIFRWLDNFPSMKNFLKVLHHKDNGRCYRTYAGINDHPIPSEADFSNFRLRLGEEKYKRIFAVLVDILKMLDLITANILSHDGTLVPTFARYRGCNYASCDCSSIRVTGDFITKTRTRILSMLENPSSIPIDKELHAYAKCPKATLPNNVKPPSIQVCAFKLLPYNPDLVNDNDQTTKLLGIENALNNHNLMLVPIRTNISKIDLNLKDNPVYVRCPKMPYDLDAKIGYRRSKYNPQKKEKVFGYQIVISTSVEPQIGLELPVCCITKPGNAKDGNYFLHLKEEIKWSHGTHTFIDIADSGFDDTANYCYAQTQGSIPIFDYNPRGENLSQHALLKRGYDKNGSPFAPCGVVCKPNGYDKKHKRLSFVCAKQCLENYTLPSSPLDNCSHLTSSLGFATHKSFWDNPRLYTEIPRASQRWKKIRNLRVSSERTNATAKSDLDILNHPHTRGLLRMAILAQLACMATLLKRFLNFVVKITLKLRRFKSTKNKKLIKELSLKKIPDFLASIFKKE